jgi:hypothetical protein
MLRRRVGPIHDHRGTYVTGDHEGMTAHRKVAAAAQREIVGDEPTTWFRTIGVGSWLVLGMAGVLALALLLDSPMRWVTTSSMAR